MGLDLLDLTFRINQQFGLNITVQDLPEIAGWMPDNPETRPFDMTVGQIYEYLLSQLRIANEVERHLNRVTRRTPRSLLTDIWTPREVWDELSQILVECLGVDPEDVTPHARLVADLGAE